MQQPTSIITIPQSSAQNAEPNSTPNEPTEGPRPAAIVVVFIQFTTLTTGSFGARRHGINKLIISINNKQVFNI